VVGFESALGTLLSYCSIRTLLTLPVLASCAGCEGIVAHPASSLVDPCSAQVIVAFSTDQGVRPSERFVQDVARAEGVRLTFLRTIGPGLYAFALAAPSLSCGDALERLRRDARVRSVDLDQRRGIA
jgi:hypothetical protein